ncbi:MAG TPA: hypothetical protein VFS00_19390, partial [Polyangiaceae bacterium]|nr:hypothetical protein [Polyangiaceae bacterium]
MGSGGGYWALLVGALAATACSANAPRPPLEDTARRVTPVPACIAPVPGRAPGGARRALREPELWKLVFPQFDPSSFRVPADARACNGQVGVREALGAGPAEGGWVKVPQGSLVYGGGADRLKIIWLPLADANEGSVQGALALVRSFDDTAELYAVGVHEGRRPTTSFALERLGSELLVVANDDGCRGHAEGECATSARVYADRQGLLREVAHFDLQRVALGRNTEPGLGGNFVYRLTATPTFGPDGIKLLEQVNVRDAMGREVRSAELERRYTPGPRGTMLPSDDP